MTFPVLKFSALLLALLALPVWHAVGSLQPGRMTPPWMPGREGDEQVYRTAEVERGDITAKVQAAGSLNALVLVEVGSQISGQIRDLFVDFNSTVTEGQVIARLEPEIYEAKLVQAQAEVHMTESQLIVQQAQIEKSRSELDNARAAHAAAKAQTVRAELALEEAARTQERKRKLAGLNVVAAGEWDRVQSEFRSAQAQVTALRADEASRTAAISAAEAALRMSEAQVGNIKAQITQREAILRQAAFDLARTYIRAPVTGTVVNRAVSRGQTVAASLQAPVLFTIAQDLSRMQVEASIVEADVSRFEVGQPVEFTVDAHPGRIFGGSVKQVRKAPQVVQNVVTYTVVIAADNPDGLLLPGMTANLDVIVGRRAGVLRVSNAALRFRPRTNDTSAVSGGHQPGALAATSRRADAGTSGQVFVLGADAGLTRIPLLLGITDGAMTEVLSGNLAEGQNVVLGYVSGTSGSSRRGYFSLRLQ